MRASSWLWLVPLLTVPAGCAGDRPDLGVRDGRLAPCPATPNCVSSQAPPGGHAIAPLDFRGEPEPSFARLREVLLARRDTRLVAEAPDYLRVEFRTRLGFVDDGEFLLDRRARLIQVRSAARLGYSDFGKNRQRLEEIRTAFGRPR